MLTGIGPVLAFDEDKVKWIWVVFVCISGA